MLTLGQPVDVIQTRRGGKGAASVVLDEAHGHEVTKSRCLVFGVIYCSVCRCVEACGRHALCAGAR